MDKEKKKIILGHLSKRHSAPARKQAVLRRAALEPSSITQIHVVKTEKG